MDLIIAGLPFTTATPDAWMVDGGRAVTGDAEPHTDHFVHPATGETHGNAPLLLTPAPAGDFQLVAQVLAFHSATFDAGALMVWAGDTVWGKLASSTRPRRWP